MKPITVGDVVAVFTNRRFVAALVTAIHDDHLIVCFSNEKCDDVLVSREAISRNLWTTR